MNFSWTLIGLIFSIFLLALCLIAERKKAKADEVRLIPWLPLAFIALVAILAFSRHILTLLGEVPGIK